MLIQRLPARASTILFKPKSRSAATVHRFFYSTNSGTTDGLLNEGKGILKPTKHFQIFSSYSCIRSTSTKNASNAEKCINTTSAQNVSAEKLEDPLIVCTNNSNVEILDPFIYRHIGPSEPDIKAMLESLNISSIDELINLTVPQDIRLTPSSMIDIHPEMRNLQNERRAMEKLKSIAALNIPATCLIGQGFVSCNTPAVLRRLILESPGWYTPYTPYQSEISQGRLEALLTFQTAVCELTGMEVANASLLCEASAAAEAMLMLYRLATTGDQNTFLVSSSVHPQTLSVLRTRARFTGIQVEVVEDSNDVDLLDSGDILMNKNMFGVLIQSPDSFGRLRNFSGLSARVHEAGGHVVAAVDPLLLAILKPPSEFGADVCVASSQRLGLPLGGGGPSAGIFSTKNEFIRQMPGSEAFRLTLQTREQHIKRNRATSNICTSQALLASTSGLFVVFHGADGLRSLALAAHHRALRLRSLLLSAGWVVVNKDNFVDTLTLDTNPLPAEDVLQVCQSKGFYLRYHSLNRIGVTLSDTIELDEVDKLASILIKLKGRSFISSPHDQETSAIPPSFLRPPDNFLTQPVFNMPKCESNLMRYIRCLERKDLGLDYSMIPLGSCTMKLNPAAALSPILWPHFADIHPFSPPDSLIGYQELGLQLSESLCAITGLDACSLQPNSGATGEYAGLYAIRAYHESIGQSGRDICLIPKSAHGQDPA